MTTLYIIGNGFDLMHELKTNYADFHDHAETYLKSIETYFDFPSDHPYKDNKPWHDFENSLSYFTPDYLFDACNTNSISSDNFTPKQLYGLEDEVKNSTDLLITELRETFESWIASIKVSDAKPVVQFCESSKFINFNYTSTLQEVYNIADENILHIHGATAKTHQELIFGHNSDQYSSTKANDDQRSPLTEAETTAEDAYRAFKKPTQDILQRHKNWFANLSGVSNILIMGHSLNEIDAPYFTEICQNAPDASWTAYCHKDKEQDKHHAALKTFGVTESKIKTKPYPIT